jgi:hypothetical protein
MLQKVIAIDSEKDTGKLLTREALDAYEPASEPWQKQFARRYQHHKEMMGILNNVEDVDNTVYEKFAVAVTPYMAQLMDKDDANCPIRKQYLPTFSEETKPQFATMLDQLGEEGDTIPGTSVVHRYSWYPTPAPPCAASAPASAWCPSPTAVWPRTRSKPPSTTSPATPKFRTCCSPVAIR